MNCKGQGRHKGNRNYYIDERDKELYIAFRNAKRYILETDGVVLLPKAADIARHTTTSRYFVSERRASEVIKAMCKHIDDDRDYRGILGLKVLSKMRFQTKRMYANLYITYKNISYEYPNETHEELITRACACPAPEFFLSLKSTIIILNNIKRNKAINGKYTSDQMLIKKNKER